MNEKEALLRGLVAGTASRYIGCKNGDPVKKQLIAFYNTVLPHPRGVAMTDAMSWCAMFVSDMGVITNLRSVIPFECGCGEMVNLAKKAGSWKGKVVPQCGDIIMYDQNKDGWADHTGIVEEVWENYVTTIEGNVSGGQCCRKTVLLSDEMIMGYICPDYASVYPEPEFPWIGQVQVKVNTRTSPERGTRNYCNIEDPAGTPIRHALVPGEEVKVIGESGNYWQVEINGRYTWTPFIAKTVSKKDTVKRI